MYLGEYASWGNIWYNALAEAVYLTALERNGDVVQMASYAPLLAKEGYTQWNPDLIYFNNTDVKPTANYEVQKLFGTHAGTEYVPGVVELSNHQEPVKKRFAFSVVKDSKTKEVIIKMVNLLPVAINASLDLSGLSIRSKYGKRVVLQGDPAEKSLKPVETEIAVTNKLASELPAYSLTVIRLKGGE